MGGEAGRELLGRGGDPTGSGIRKGSLGKWHFGRDSHGQQ